MIEQRLQDKLKKETDTVRRAEEAKKEKQISNRKEEELQLKDSIVCGTSFASDASKLIDWRRCSINSEGHGSRCCPTSFALRMPSLRTARPCLQLLPIH